MDWLRPVFPPEIAPQDVHVWRASLDVPPVSRERYLSFLSPEERARADRFVFPRDKEHFIAGRGRLRELLGHYLNQPPEKITLQTNPWGKPLVMDPAGGHAVHFNLSHSHGMAVYAFSPQGQVGIDMEKIRPLLDTEEIAKKYFSPKENQELQSLPVGLRAEGFFLCWTRKESYIKARGEGLRIPLREFDVSISAESPVELRSEDAPKWTMYSFQPAAHFVAACVVPHTATELRLLELNDSSNPAQP